VTSQYKGPVVSRKTTSRIM